MTVEELLVKIKLENKSFKKDAEDAKKSLTGITGALGKITQRFRQFNSQIGTSTRQAMQGVAREADKAGDAMESAADRGAEGAKKYGAAMDKAKTVLNAIKVASLAARQDAGLIAMTDDAIALTVEIQKAQAAIELLNGWMANEDPNGEEYARDAEHVKEYTERISELEDKLRSMPTFGEGGLYRDVGAPSNIKDLIAYLNEAKLVAQGFGREIARGIGERVPRSVRSAGSAITRFAIKAKNDFVSLGSKLKGVISRFNPFKKGVGDISNSMQGGIRSILKYALGIGSLVILFNKVRSAMKEGLNNLSQYSGATRSALNSLKGSLTQVKDSLGVAFAPVLNVVAPILQTLVNYLTVACNAIAQFFAALTGQSTVALARTDLGSVAAAMGDAEEATGGANSAAEKYKRTLMGFDQINKLDDSSGSGSGGGGVSGVGGGAGFYTENVASVYSGWAEKVKEAWANADFYDIGQAIGTKLKEGLESIPWDEIEAFGEKVAKSIATGLNGFFETPGLSQEIGKSVAKLFETGLNTLTTFVSETHWDSIGSFVSSGIQSAFKEFEWGKVTEFISAKIKALFDLGTGFLSGIDFKTLPQDIVDAIKEAITGFNFTGVFNSAGKLVGTAIVSAIDLVTGLGDLISGFFSDIGKYFKKHIDDAKENGGSVADGILNGILDAFKGIGKWISTNIFEPFWSGICSAFGIDESESKKMLSVGGDIIDGLISGIKGGWDIIVQWFEGLVADIQAFFEDPVGTIKLSLDIGVLSDFKNTWDSIQDKSPTMMYQETGSDAIYKSSNAWNSVNSKKPEMTLATKGADAINKASTSWNSIKTSSATKTIKGSTKKSFTDTKDKYDKLKSKSITAKLSGAMDTVATKIYTIVNNNGKTITVHTSASGGTHGGSSGKLKASGGIYKGGSWHPVTAAAIGGSFNTGQMFIARERGPELVGTIGGHTSVMNNDQIVSSVEAGVYRAVLSAMSQGGGSNVNISIEGDLGKLFRAVRTEAANYTRATGQPAFPV